MSTALASFLDYLDKVHARTRRVAVLIPPDALEWALAPGRFTPGDIVRHLAGIERWMYAETVHGRPTCYPGHGTELAAGTDAVMDYHDRLHAESRALFAALPDATLESRCGMPGGGGIAIGKWLRLMVEHEAHHRGQLYLLLGLRGVVTPPIYGMTEGALRGLSAVAAVGGPPGTVS